MAQLRWRGGNHPLDSVESAVAFLKALAWNLSIRKIDEQWYVFTGDQSVFMSQTQQETEAFVLGMAVSFNSLPEMIFRELQNSIEKDW